MWPQEECGETQWGNSRVQKGRRRRWLLNGWKIGCLQGVGKNMKIMGARFLTFGKRILFLLVVYTMHDLGVGRDGNDL